ncbi:MULTISPECIES: AAA family ATPase [Peptacetobacter]|uniref:AAA family ATPase n=1 Tax=Peptacetobacter TaxID=2743582 RepID=UPI0019176522|nr:ATP-binding protein [Peptacetobacter hiranonis]QQQ87060.1 ATP-binding protein [Peptacetobacter hiranonis]
MLLEYRCSNYKSIKDEVLFSMSASSDTEHSDKLIDFKKLKINKATAIYGANGSGKSSLLESCLFLTSLVSNKPSQPGDKILVIPHALSAIDEPTELLIHFERKGIRYVYGISVTEDRVEKEFLYHFKVGRKAKIFDRVGEEYTFGAKYKSDLNKALSFQKENRVFLNTAANFTNNEDITNAFLFFKEDLVVNSPSFMNNWREYSFNMINKNPEFKKKVVTAFNNLGIDIKDIKTESFNIPLHDELVENIPADIKEIIKSSMGEEKTLYLKKVLFDYGIFSVDIDRESTGIKRLFEVLCPLIDIIENDRVLLWDEIEMGLHSSILDTLIKIFLNEKDSKAQLIFTTHDISLLNLDNLRRDQIWFTELDKEERKTDLYSLFDFKNIRKTDNISKNYIEGRYGAIPFIKTNLQSIQEEV